MMSLWDALRMNMMISYQELVRTFPKCAANGDNSECIALLSDLTNIYIRTFKSFAPGFDQA